MSASRPFGWFKLLFHLYNTDTSKGNTALISGMNYTNGIQKKVSRLIQICIPFCTITYVYSILRNCHVYNTVYIKPFGSVPFTKVNAQLLI